MKNLFYTSPKYLQNLKGLDSSASEIDDVVATQSIYLDSPATFKKYQTDRKVTINDFSGNTFSEKLKNASVWASIDSSLGKTLYIPKGYYTLNASEAIVFAHHGISIVGDGAYETVINVVFSANNQDGIKISKGSSPLYNVNVKDITFLAATNSFSNTKLVSLSDVGSVFFESVRLMNIGVNNVSLSISGREQCTFLKCFITADKPILLNKNPNTTNGFVSIDHFHFIDGFYMTGNGQSMIKIEDGAEISGLRFSGQPSFIGGKHIVEYILTTTTSNSRIITHDGGRWEQHDSETNASAYKITTPNYGEFKNITVSNFYNTHGSIIEGYGITNVTINNCINVGTAPFVILNEVRSFKHSNVYTENIKPIVTGMKENFAILDADKYNVPIEGYYTKDFSTGSKYNRPIRINGAELMGIQKSMAAGTVYSLNIRNDQLSKFAKLDITIVTDDGTIADSGVFLITKSATLGSSGVIKISGGAIFSSINLDTKFCIYNNSATPLDNPVLHNRTGLSINIHCIINSATELAYS